MIRAYERGMQIAPGQELTVLTYAAGHGPVGKVQLITLDTEAFEVELIDLTPTQARAISQALLLAADAAEHETTLLPTATTVARAPLPTHHNAA